MGLLSSKSSSTAIDQRRFITKTQADYSTDETNQAFAGQAASAGLSNIVDSDVTLTLEQYGLSGSDLTGLFNAAAAPVNKATDTLGSAFRTFSDNISAAENTSAGILGAVNNALDALKSAAIPIAIVIAIWALVKYKGLK